MEEQATVYNVQIGEEQRKAFDVIALKQFLEAKKLSYSVLSLDPSRLNDDDKIMSFVARAAVNTLIELENALDQILGIAPPVETEVEPEQEKEPIKVKDKIKESFTDETEVVAEVDESDEKIIL